MKDLRLFTTSAACALGAAVLTTVLHSTPAEAQTRAVKTGGPHKQTQAAIRLKSTHSSKHLFAFSRPNR